MKDIVESYKKLNTSFKKTLIFRVGLDAGFFTEYNYMIKAMIFCLENEIQFKLYSVNANFSYKNGWTDFFNPFCDEIFDDFHQKYNLHKSQPWHIVFHECSQHKSIRPLLWKIKSVTFSLLGRLIALCKYHKATLLTHNVHFVEKKHYNIPNLNINGDFFDIYKFFVEITWNFKDDISNEITSLKNKYNIPTNYVGCQIRGGDKITETSLITPDRYIPYIKAYNKTNNCFVLTDDYQIFCYLKSKYADINWFTFCAESEHGYVNKNFTQQKGEDKRLQMIRFLSSVEILKEADHFIGTIMAGPCCFLFSILPSDKYSVVDCKKDNLKSLLLMSIRERLIAIDTNEANSNL